MFVEYAYKLYNDADDKLLFETPAKEPDMMICGVSQEIVPGLMAAMEGLKAGDRFGVTLPPAAAFGDYNPEDVIRLDAKIFMRDGEMAEEVKPGAMIPMMTAEGYRIMGKVLEVGKEKVKMDFNHPFAGLTVRYDGEVVSVREATEDELHPAHGCCGGGCGSNGCGDGCNSDKKEGNSCGCNGCH